MTSAVPGGEERIIRERARMELRGTKKSERAKVIIARAGNESIVEGGCG